MINDMRCNTHQTLKVFGQIIFKCKVRKKDEGEVNHFILILKE